MSTWGRQPPAGSGGNTWWGTPSPENTNWQAPGHNRMFGGDVPDPGDPTGRAFTTRKRHGWWGKEERYDMQGRRID